MTEAPHNVDQEEIAGARRVRGFSRYDTARALATLGLVFSSFTFVASLTLWFYTRSQPEFDAIRLPGGLALRAGLFGGLSAAFAVSLWGLRTGEPVIPLLRLPRPVPAGALWALGVLLLLTTLLLSYRLSNYPWTAPDEVHHLVVAKNLALYGSYASGHPDTGLTYFDSFDSVGPTVIGPIAILFRLFGVSLGVARGVMVAYFLLLCVATFMFARRSFGAWPGVAAVALLVGTFSSIYLGRTLYGEVAAHAWLLLGLLTWQRSLVQPGFSGWGVVAGVLLAFAVLTKTIIILVAFSAAAAWVYDRVTFRAIGGGHVVAPILGGGIVLGLWEGFTRLHGADVTADGGMLAIYQHYLLFGISSLPHAFENSVAVNPIAHGVWLVVALGTVPLVFYRRYTPSSLVLFLYALFVLYWWFFFTPGQLHRYLWSAYAILALFSAPWLVSFARKAFMAGNRRRVRLLCCLAVAIILAPGLRWVALQSREIGTHDEQSANRDLVAAVEALPPDFRLATTSGRIPGLLNFFSDRAVETGESIPTLLLNYDVVLAPDSPEHRASLPSDTYLKSVGTFVLLSRTRPLE